MAVFSNFLCSSGTSGLSPGSMWGTHVSSTIVDGEHVFGHSLGHSPQSSTAIGEPAPLNSMYNHIGGPHMSKWQCHSSGEEATGPGYSYQKSLLIESEDWRSSSWGSKGTARRPFAGILI